jgi:hypothetical protein
MIGQQEQRISCSATNGRFWSPSTVFTYDRSETFCSDVTRNCSHNKTVLQDVEEHPFLPVKRVPVICNLCISNLLVFLFSNCRNLIASRPMRSYDTKPGVGLKWHVMSKYTRQFSRSVTFPSQQPSVTIIEIRDLKQIFVSDPLIHLI